MYRYKNILVCADLTEKDITLIKYVSLLSKMAESEKIYICHVAKSLEIPKDLMDEYPELIEPVDEYAISQLKQIVSSHYTGKKEAELHYIISEGNVLYELLKNIKQKNIDLVLVGKQKRNQSRSKLAEKLCRKAPCSVLVIPENTEPKISNILVPIDFSDNSTDAIDVAIAFGNAAGLKHLNCLHAYKLPLGFYKTGKSEAQFSEIMKKNAEKQYKNFINVIDLKGLKMDCTYVLSDNVINSILDKAKDLNSDLVILGAQGRNAGAAILLGSTTEHIIWASNFPVLAAKKKGSGMSFLDALLKI